MFIMREAEKRLLRCCFTGHRPEKLRADESSVCMRLEAAVKIAIRDGYRTFISGMARGVDIWAAEIVLKQKAVNPQVRLICALPHPDFEKRWKADWQKRYSAVLEQADYIKTVSPKFSMESYQIRNKWMVDHSARVIAIFNGEKGGTKNTIEYAQKQGVSVWRYDV